MNRIRIDDESGDRRYFTQIPNIILNHSSATDQALYLQMKRLAGEGGSCYAGYRYYCKQLGIGFKAYKKSMQYLLDHKWVYLKGKEYIEGSGGPQLTNVYGLNDIWKMNVEHYDTKSKGGSRRDHPRQGGVQSSPKVVLKGNKGGAESEHKNIHISNILKEEEISLKEKESIERRRKEITRKLTGK